MHIQVRTIRDVEGLDGIEQRWRSLFATSPAASPPLHFVWLREWWRIYGPTYGNNGQGLRVLTLWRDTHLIGALPLYEQEFGGKWAGCRRLRFLSTGERTCEETCAVPMDLLYAPGEAGACVDAVRYALFERGDFRWDEIDLCDIHEDSPLLSLAATARRCNAIVSNRGPCLMVDLSGGFDAYMQRLSPKTRSRARQELRSVERSGGHFMVAESVPEAHVIFEQLVALHQARWIAVGEPGCFAAPRFTQFHRRLCERLVSSGEAILASLSVDGRALAVVYGFVARMKFDHYQSGTVVEGVRGVHSPGTAALLLLMRYLADRGINTFDFLRGQAAYKQRLATSETSVLRLQFAHRTIRRQSQYALTAVQRGLRRALRPLLPSVAPKRGNESVADGHASS